MENKQRISDKKWMEKNKEHSRYLKDRTSARSFVRHKATIDDMEELNKIFREENKNYKNK